MLTQEEIQEFKELVKKTKSLELTDEQDEDQGSRLIQAMELIANSKRNSIKRVYAQDELPEDLDQKNSS